MAENKADKAIKKVIINLIPEEYFGKLAHQDKCVKIDISDKLDAATNYYLQNIQIENGETGTTIPYVSYADYHRFMESVENILDATIVNSKQRESIQKLLAKAFYDRENIGSVI